MRLVLPEMMTEQSNTNKVQTTETILRFILMNAVL